MKLNKACRDGEVSKIFWLRMSEAAHAALKWPGIEDLFFDKFPELREQAEVLKVAALRLLLGSALDEAEDYVETRKALFLARCHKAADQAEAERGAPLTADELREIGRQMTAELVK